MDSKVHLLTTTTLTRFNFRQLYLVYQDAIKNCLIQQFFIHSDKRRDKETLETLAMNIYNDNIDEIHLINERTYTTDETGTNNKKVRQIIMILSRCGLLQAKLFLFSKGLSFCLTKKIIPQCLSTLI